MPKYLIQASYTAEGLKALKKESPLNRMWVVKDAVASVAGKLDSMYWALGEDEAILILDLPDAQTAAALSMHVGAAGLVRTKTTRLIALRDMEKSLAQVVDYQVDKDSSKKP